ncbi:29136_t:CDS:2, partial [Gigaspora margarita]
MRKLTESKDKECYTENQVTELATSQTKDKKLLENTNTINKIVNQINYARKLTESKDGIDIVNSKKNQQRIHQRIIQEKK